MHTRVYVYTCWPIKTDRFLRTQDGQTDTILFDRDGIKYTYYPREFSCPIIISSFVRRCDFSNITACEFMRVAIRISKRRNTRNRLLVFFSYTHIGDEKGGREFSTRVSRIAKSNSQNTVNVNKP